MSGFDPGEGWREFGAEERYEGPRRDQLMWTGTDVGDVRYWVREVPVPPLPDAPYTVIRVTWKPGSEPNAYTDGTSVLFLDPTTEAEWALNAVRIPSKGLAERVTGFEVFAEPRAVTRLKVVSDVIDFFRREAGPDAAPDDWRTRAADTIAAEWEVDR